MTEEEYKKQFKKNQKNALEYALDIRKFEIDLYWKRATYFWAFIAAALAGYSVIQQISINEVKEELSFLLACFGMVFSFAWYLVNRGSKFWQNNWERHVDLLEDEITGPLYKTIIKESSAEGSYIKSLATNTGEFSVTKINQILSLFVFNIWIILCISNFYFSWFSILITTLTLYICYGLYYWTKSSNGSTGLTIYNRKLDVS
ncbi:hypothetical protein CRU94_04435 [Arcobacter sp. AHV-9/2010]|uniref:RipA family octameric membrane protein n=1 Tax=Arcobacter sp. AHV-9/2010 TaxID=2021861 RepID=UPI00100B521A|nr:hypothetical protein [Arcobacter sp. CECT 9299]RXJ95865.1 hypothetical protein CRU94_04435 [Arcobacter sp. CECT 9299]